MSKIFPFIAVASMTFMLSSCMADFTQTKFPQAWAPAKKSDKDINRFIDGTYSGYGEYASDRETDKRMKTAQLGFVLTLEHDEPARAASKAISFTTLKNGDIKVTSIQSDCNSERIWIKGKDFVNNKGWVVRKETSTFGTATGTTKLHIGTNVHGDLIIEETVSGFGFYIVIGAMNVNKWYRFKKDLTVRDVQAPCKNIYKPLKKKQNEPDYGPCGRALDRKKGKPCCDSVNCRPGLECVDHKCRKSSTIQPTLSDETSQ